MKNRVLPLLLLALCLSAAAGQARAFDECGDLRTHYGPFDYWIDKPKLGIVESYHFTSEVETLKAGRSGYIGGDLDYTLRAFPNHPRALMAMIRLSEKEKTDHPRGAQFSVVCYLERAVRFRPNDSMARMIFGSYLAKRKKSAEALVQLEAAQKDAGENANLHYNIGLVYIDLGQFDKALVHAQKAYRLGFELPGLRAKLEKAGKWRDPEPVAADPEKAAVVEPADATTPAVDASPQPTVAPPAGAVSEDLAPGNGK
jgi:tetratricopeptide (TPR) repeat protein